jgi:uncharacterized protein with GYD domain
MAMFMWMARYTPAAAKTIVESGLDREEMARKTVEAAGGKLLGFYGLIGQKHHFVLICDMPGLPQFLGTVLAATLGGAIEDFKTIPMYSWGEFESSLDTYKDLQQVYAPPG